MRLQSFDQQNFFDLIAENLRSKGVLADYEKPIGDERHDWPKWSKQTHSSESKNVPGQMRHIGDVPYDFFPIFGSSS